MFLLIDTLSIAQDSLSIANDTIMAVTPIVPGAASVDSLVLSKQALKAIMAVTNDEPSLTDWVQAIAAVVAAVGVVRTLYDLVSNSKKQQEQIDKLGTIAKGLEEQINQDKERRRLEIRPNLIYKEWSENSGIVNVKIENSGKVATNVKFFNKLGLTFTLFSVTSLQRYEKVKSNTIYPEKTMAFQFSFSDTNTNITRNDYDFWVYFNDQDGNEYVQFMKYLGREKDLTSNHPELLGHVTDWLNPKSNRYIQYNNVETQILGSAKHEAASALV